MTFKPFGASNTSRTEALGGLDLAAPDDPAVAAARLEAALERIAALADQVAAERAHELALEDAPDGSYDAVEVAERLDALIAKLRAALSGRPG